ncbi:uncharacterized protein DDB_G0287625-like [Benincasa hispida]|uniref:uncharacterized protein DDB_G0287625-like n=1 Tax=Benincasa hispida TaxID=102211 RepID=UPI0018FF748F|nr:uncharacterized protein DDB_G0287625-like [Benincasa hispida]
MCTTFNHLSFFYFFILLLSSVQIEARVNKFFSKFIHTDHKVVSNLTLAPVFAPPEISPSLAPIPALAPFFDESHNAYGLYDRDANAGVNTRTITNMEEEILAGNDEDEENYKAGYPMTNSQKKIYENNNYENNNGFTNSKYQNNNENRNSKYESNFKNNNALFLLSSLSDSCKTLVVTISNSAPEDILSLDVIKQNMFNEELRRKDMRVDNSHALVVENPGRNKRKGPKDHGNSKGRSKSTDKETA